MSFISVDPVSVKSEDVFSANTRACYGCLATHGELYDLMGTNLQQIFTDLTGCTLVGVTVCWVCRQLLRKFQSFRLSCLHAVNVLASAQSEIYDTLRNQKPITKHNFAKTKTVLTDYIPTNTILPNPATEYSENKGHYIEENFENDNDHKLESDNKNDTFDDVIENGELIISDIVDALPSNIFIIGKERNKKRKIVPLNTKDDKNSKKLDRKAGKRKSNDIAKKRRSSDDSYEPNCSDHISSDDNDLTIDTSVELNELESPKSEERMLIVKIASTFRRMWRGKTNNDIFGLLERIHTMSLDVKCDDDDTEESLVIKKYLDCNKKLSDIYNVDVEFVSVVEQREEMDRKRQSTLEEGFCDMCCRKYNSAETFDRHRNRTHSEASSNECAICRYRYKLQRDLVGHLLGNHARKIRCRQCGATVVDEKWSNIREHFESHRGLVTTCKWCGKNFTVKKVYYMHVRSMHSVQMSRAECLLCGDLFNGPDGLRQHVNKIHTQAAQCSLCDVWFKDADTLATHQQQDVSCGDGHSGCPTCGSNFTSSELMRSHYDQQHAQRKCPQCKKLFVSVSKLKAHKCRLNRERGAGAGRRRGAGGGGGARGAAGEGGDRPPQPYRFVCEFCGKNFKQKIQLQLHQRTHTGERPYECDTCHKTFAQEYFLKVHQRKHTGQRFQCDVCKKTYAIENYLKIHMRVHTGARPYPCPYCPNTFRQPSHLRAHMPSHTKERAHVCEVCQKSFTQRCNMLEHVRVIHDGLPPRSRQRRGKQHDF